MPLHNGGGSAKPAQAGLLQTGPRIPVEIQVPAALVQHLTKQGKPVPPPVSGYCLIDTGASSTSVDAGAVASLGLAPINLVQVHTPSGATPHLVYPAQFEFPGTQLPRANFNAVIACPLKSQGIIALFGRDVLAHYVLIYNGPMGTFTLAV